jgi:hypothetical protein
MKVDLPPAPQTYDPDYFIRAFAAINQAFGGTVVTNEAVNAVLLRSPNGSVYKLSISNTGTVVATAVPLGQTGAPKF